MSLWTFVCSVHLCSLWEKEHFWDTQGSFFSHRAHRVHWAFLRTVSSPQNAFGIQSSQSVTAKDGCKVLWYRLTSCLCGPLCVLFICVFLWEIECSHCMIQHTNNTLGSFFSHRAHRVHWAFWRTFRAHRTPPTYRYHRALLPMKIPIRRQKQPTSSP